MIACEQANNSIKKEEKGQAIDYLIKETFIQNREVCDLRDIYI